jgi:hypothetical protein
LSLDLYETGTTTLDQYGSREHSLSRLNYISYMLGQLTVSRDNIFRVTSSYRELAIASISIICEAEAYTRNHGKANAVR